MKRKFSIKAIETSDLFTLNKQDLAKIDAEYEEVLVEMFYIARKRLKRTI